MTMFCSGTNCLISFSTWIGSLQKNSKRKKKRNRRKEKERGKRKKKEKEEKGSRFFIFFSFFSKYYLFLLFVFFSHLLQQNKLLDFFWRSFKTKKQIQKDELMKSFSFPFRLFFLSRTKREIIKKTPSFRFFFYCNFYIT